MARETFDHSVTEAEARKKWESLDLYKTDLADTTKEPYYLLFEFPYPSGDLHVGHWYAFAITDIFARFKRMKGFSVLFPFGFDAFGLPAENAAIKRGLDPRKWTYENMDSMREQVKTMGTSVDFSKEVITCDPEYYAWTQWLFCRLYEKGIAYRGSALVNWDPVDMTVLANEQVLPDGTAERSGAVVEKKELVQWFMKITDYADRLITDLDPLPWKEDIKDAQRAWIGKSEGAELPFTLETAKGNKSVSVFTTRADTLYGVTYLVLAPELALVETLLTSEEVTNAEEVRAYIALTKSKTDRDRMQNKEKTGVQLEGVIARHPITHEALPVYIADYVLASYGTGAVMAVPAHDERDNAFAKKFGLPVIPVIQSEEVLYGGDGILTNSGEFSGRVNTEALEEIVTLAGGTMKTQFRLRDWGVSRQRYWGCPIPVVYDPEGTPHLVPDEHLPWKLPEDVDLTPGKHTSPLASSTELKERVTRIFGEGWTPEYDTLDTFVDSSWYYMRYLAPHDSTQFSDMARMKKWLPVSRYSGGSEHTTLHLLYSRFFNKALFDMGLAPTSEPFVERMNRGLILGTDGNKMSKSKGNTVNPDEYVQKYGADAVRMYLAFIGPYNEAGSYPWKPEGVESMRRFLDRVYTLSQHVHNDVPQSTHEKVAIAKAIEKLDADIERFKLNTAVSALMILMNEFEAQESVSVQGFTTLLVLLAPMAPHLAETLYEKLPGYVEGTSVHTESWPVLDASLLTSSVVTIGVQVGGKRRGEIQISPSATEHEALEAALGVPGVQSALQGATPSRVIYVPGKILNLIA